MEKEITTYFLVLVGKDGNIIVEPNITIPDIKKDRISSTNDIFMSCSQIISEIQSIRNMEVLSKIIKHKEISNEA